jgi:hypothetical protein
MPAGIFSLNKQIIIMPPKVYGSYKNGEDIYKDKKGFYIIQWNVKEKKEVKKHLKSLAATVKRGEKALKNWTRRRSRR